MDEVKFCKTCRAKKNDNDIIQEAYFPYWDDNDYTCPSCRETLTDTIMTSDEFMDIVEVSNTLKFFEAMIDLKEKDIIEYELKMSQFRNQTKSQTKETESSKPKCPHCGSTAITAGQRGYSLVWGLFGSGNTVNRCSNCGHKWKPGK